MFCDSSGTADWIWREVLTADLSSVAIEVVANSWLDSEEWAMISRIVPNCSLIHLGVGSNVWPFEPVRVIAAFNPKSTKYARSTMGVQRISCGGTVGIILAINAT